MESVEIVIVAVVWLQEIDSEAVWLPQVREDLHQTRLIKMIKSDSAGMNKIRALCRSARAAECRAGMTCMRNDLIEACFTIAVQQLDQS